MTTEWINGVDVDQLDDDQAMFYKEYRDLRAKANAARIEFETSMQSLAKPGFKLVFNYQFGKLSLAQVPGTYSQDKPKAKTNKPSLSEFLAKQSANGRSA